MRKKCIKPTPTPWDVLYLGAAPTGIGKKVPNSHCHEMILNPVIPENANDSMLPQIVANMEFVKTAVNNHVQMLEALKAVERIWDMYNGLSKNPAILKEFMDMIYLPTITAIKEAEGGRA